METDDLTRVRADGPLAHAVERLTSRRHAFLVGAGISFPSGVPTVAPFRLKLLHGLGLNEVDIAQYIRANVPFESFVEVLMGLTDCTALLQLFRGRESALGHRVIARLAKYNLISVIITTNFDCLLEAALASEGVSFDVLTSERSFESLDWSSPHLLLIKLHGTIDDLDELAITIRKVAARQFADVRGKVVRDLFTQDLDDGLVILGYSCSDHFDVSPAARSAVQHAAQILYVAHDSNCDRPIEARLRDFLPDNPFAGFDSTVLSCNTDVLLRTLAQKLPGDSILKVAHKETNWAWEKELESWLKQLEVAATGGIRSHISGLLLKSANLWNRSNEYLFTALREGVPECGVSRVLLAIGNNCRDSGRANEAVAILRVALHQARKTKDAQSEARIINSLGIIAEDLGDHERAIDLNRQALDASREARDRELEGKCHGNLGIALKNRATGDDLYLALGHHLVALDIAKQIGDKRSEGRTLGNMGLVYRALKEVSTACEYYKAARNVAELLGDILHVGIWLHNMGEDLADGDPDQAKGLLERSAALFAGLGQSEFARESEDVLKRLRDRATRGPSGS